MPSSYILSPEKSRPFGKIHKSATIVLAPLHTFLINTLLIFNRFSAIMYIETEAEAIPRSIKRTFIFLPLFSFRKGPGADWSSAPGFFRFLFHRGGGRAMIAPTRIHKHPRCMHRGCFTQNSEFSTHIDHFVPKMRSPASPRPGTMYLCSFRRSSQAAM